MVAMAPGTRAYRTGPGPRDRGVLVVTARGAAMDVGRPMPAMARVPGRAP
jgi:hypothetical protein